MVRILLLILLVFSTLAIMSGGVLANPRPKTLGRLTLENIPAYGVGADFSWVLPKKPLRPVLGVLCRQNGAWAFIGELPQPRYREWQDHMPLDNEHGGRFDYTAPAYCTGLVWDELGNGQQPVGLTNAVSFVVP